MTDADIVRVALKRGWRWSTITNRPWLAQQQAEALDALKRLSTRSTGGVPASASAAAFTAADVAANECPTGT